MFKLSLIKPPHKPSLKEIKLKKRTQNTQKYEYITLETGTHLHNPTDLLELSVSIPSFDPLRGSQTPCNRYPNFHHTIARNYACDFVTGPRCNTVPCLYATSSLFTNSRLYTDSSLYTNSCLYTASCLYPDPCVHTDSLHQSTYIG